MIPYILTGLIIIALNVLFFHKTKYSFYGYFISFVVLYLLCVLRNISVGTDYQYYADMFKIIGEHAVSHIKSKELLWKKEYGWYYMNKGFYNYGTFFLYVCCYYFILYFLVFRSILDKSSIPLLSILLYFFCGYYFASYNVMRQALVFSFFLYAIRYIESREFIKYSLILAIASLIHLSGLFLIPFYFVRYFKWSKSFLIILLLASLFFGFSNFFIRIVPYIHFERLKNYIMILHKEISFYGYLLFAINTGLSIVFLVFTKDINSRESLYLKFVIFGLILSNLVMHFQWLFRFSEVFFTPIMIIGYTNVISKCTSRNNKLILTSVLLFYAITIFFLTLTSNSNGIVPYKLIS
jgi:transmembrane protein EpsG